MLRQHQNVLLKSKQMCHASGFHHDGRSQGKARVSYSRYTHQFGLAVLPTFPECEVSVFQMRVGW